MVVSYVALVSRFDNFQRNKLRLAKVAEVRKFRMGQHGCLIVHVPGVALLSLVLAVRHMSALLNARLQEGDQTELSIYYCFSSNISAHDI